MKNMTPQSTARQNSCRKVSPAFIASQAGGDAAVLADHGRPVLQLHLTDHDAGLAQLREALQAGGRA